MLKFECNAKILDAEHLLHALTPRRMDKPVRHALNNVALDARDAVRSDMPRRFTIRRPWAVRGIGAEFARAGRLESAVYSRDAFMRDHEVGANRHGTQIIPVGRMAGVHRARVIPKSLWPRSFFARGKGVYHKGTLFERRHGQLSPLYLFRKRVRVAPRFGMEESVRGVVAKGFEKRLESELWKALTR